MTKYNISPVTSYAFENTHDGVVGNSGQIIVKYTDEFQVENDFIYVNGVFNNIETGYKGQVIGIGNSGLVVGQYEDSVGYTHGFINDHGVFTSFDNPYSSTLNTFVRSVLPYGEIIVSDADNTRGAIYFNNTFLLLNYSATVTGINDVGQLVGFLNQNGFNLGFVDNIHSRAFSYIDAPGAKDTQVMGVTASGQFVGFYSDSNGRNHGFVDNNGAFTTIDSAGSMGTTVTGTNASGQFVGFVDNQNSTHGFVYSNGIFTLIDPIGARDTEPTSINDVRNIVETSSYGSGRSVFTVTLAPPPTADLSFSEVQLKLQAFGASPGAGSWTSDNHYHRELADVNGDGRADVVGFGEAGVYVAL
ncbi:hypothetical protein ACLBWX_23080, partial [Methylobacterium sp. M6A4_1b]